MTGETNPAVVTSAVRAILDRALSGREISREEGTVLLEAPARDLPAIAGAADEVRRARVGDAVSFVVVRNINFTNVCYMGCRFCGFARRREEAGAEWISLDEVAQRAQVAWDRGATEVCIQGGLHPDLPLHHYRDLVLAVKRQVPEMHVHAFSPFEIWHGARRLKVPVTELLLELKEAGLGSMPGTAAEILDTEVRRQLTRDKLPADAWIETVRAAHAIGLRSTSTMMYGHVDAPHHWSAHLDQLRAIQKDTGGFTEFVPLGFVHDQAPMYVDSLIPGVRPGATPEEHLKVHAVARLMLAGWIDNIQVSWVKLGTKAAHDLLAAGVNDLGGTLMDESISRSAGSLHGEEVTAREMVRIIRAAGRRAQRRNTLYGVLESYDDHDPEDPGPLKPHIADPLAFLAALPAGAGESRHG
ncbi:5-amino-6-(D-ribitylamino)uracil--L-tyrosine 4-hydroxyphenyl transferase CofH [Methylobacterium sp. NEAU 140]|uniref:5-amino-6-(D-ribitylamino)uracil--L-tyrosine 4-hydroxyphenyl transferase CofH n=1 Tax=Methylobacterium sp. NEAU 140 TaxID=3064945 RepID=UPI0027331779|nr:5-amino-6-(D-ribitylamino)uracil--L-tyrosine 4-hydroxyphenyl transferase CofH [Methylobacterium sp. NEAU 140]MDP4021994.1 5-amino-6-(D-ribitylamino)uracil--L-tyrosine 4-hydroxyphenyl transferase CofH [Methylobacterium sp. NEAU 140]